MVYSGIFRCESSFSYSTNLTEFEQLINNRSRNNPRRVGLSFNLALCVFTSIDTQMQNSKLNSVNCALIIINWSNMIPWNIM